MAKRTLDELYALLGTQPAEYLDDYLREKGAYLVACTACGRRCVVERKPTKREVATWRCGECAPRTKTPLETKG